MMVQKAVGQVLFWMLSYLVLFRLFTIDYDGGKSDVVYTLLFHIPIVCVVYCNVLIVDRFFKRKRWVLWASLLILLVPIGIGIHTLVFGWLSDHIAPGYFFISYYSDIQIGQFVIAYLVLSTLLFITVDWFEVRHQQSLLMNANKRIELSVLKAQVNPHFLINSLNNIYALTQETAESANDYLIRLSDVLRYVVYETAEDRVLLTQEVTHIKNYVALERLRLDDRGQISINEVGDFQGIVIAPLLLLPFVENCFKHLDRANPVVQISMKLEQATFHFSTSNRHQQDDQGLADFGGEGLDNVKKRLEIIYPNAYELDIQRKDGHFVVDLVIELLTDDSMKV